jgi:hypothetical protein
MNVSSVDYIENKFSLPGNIHGGPVCISRYLWRLPGFEGLEDLGLLPAHKQ